MTEQSEDFFVIDAHCDTLMALNGRSMNKKEQTRAISLPTIRTRISTCPSCCAAMYAARLWRFSSKTISWRMRRKKQCT